MYAEERQQAIASEVRARGRVAVADLANRFDVTGETVRRDLAVLQRNGIVQRVHGGAVRPDVVAVVDEPDLHTREIAHQEEKARIGAAAQNVLPASGGSVMFDAGTTTHSAAGQLAPDTRLTLITNSVTIGAQLAVLARSSVTLIGGRLRGKTHAAVGAGAIEQLRRLRFSVVFVGTNALSICHGLSTPDPDEAATKTAMIAAANTVVVLADSSKFNREDHVSFCPLDDVDVLITDNGIDPHFADEIRRRGVDVVIA